jgi:two-component sensor histidine kinase
VTPAGDRPSRRIPEWAIILGAWTLYGLVGAAQQHVSYALSRGEALPWSTALGTQLPLALAWAAATPVILWLGRRFPLTRARWPESVAVHLMACLTLAFLLNMGYAYLALPLLPPPTVPRPAAERGMQLFVGWVLSDAMVYWAILSVSLVLGHQRRLRARELAAAQLETQLAETELHALQMQLQPHFLFNALHTVGALVRTGDRDAALRVVTGLGDLLRRVLDRATAQEVPLRQELELATSYLEIEQVRFRDRLRVEIEAGPAALEAAVPHLLLQPLVENAIRHGIGPNPGAGLVRLEAARVGTQLRIVVRDAADVPPDPAPERRSSGIGLSNTAARLSRLYGNKGELTLTQVGAAGHEVRIDIPFRRWDDHGGRR